MRRIKGPCHGCGERDLYRAKEELCQTCQGKLELAEEVLRERTPVTGEVAVTLPTVHHNYRYVPRQPHRTWGTARDRRFQKCFDRFVRRAFRKSSDWPDHPEGLSIKSRYPFHAHDCYTSDGARVIPKHLVRPLLAVYLATIEAVELAYEQGVKDGRNFIQRLARGEIEQVKVEGIFDPEGGRER